MEFLFLRHGQTDWNLDQRLQGRSDPELNATGLAQAESAADVLSAHRIGVICTSPLQRARQTANILSTRLHVPVTAEPDLIERDFGDLEGRRLADIPTGGASGYDIATSEALPPDAEPWQSVCSRIASLLNALHHDGRGDVLFVSHLGCMCAICDVLSLPRIVARNAIPYRFRQINTGWTVSECGAGSAG